jgi:hypothetical protein
VQKYEEEQESYRKLVERIHKKSVERYKRAYKKGVSLIY